MKRTSRLLRPRQTEIAHDGIECGRLFKIAQVTGAGDHLWPSTDN